MSENEEIVYSAMGFDPILLLEESPPAENYRVNIVRSGIEETREEKNKILEDNSKANSKNNQAKNY